MIKNIVFSGGGFKSWAYIGTLQALEEYSIKGIENVIGVSAGAVFGLFYVLGIKWDYLLEYFMELNTKTIVDIDIDNILVQQSLLAGIKFTNLIQEIVSTVIDPGITFKDLQKHTKIKFTVNAINIDDNTLDYFNYVLTPDIKVIDAVRASCTLPIILPPYPINGKFYYDGGMCNNCPINLMDEVDSIAFDLKTDGVNSSPIKLFDLLQCLSIITNKHHKKENYNVYRILDNKFKNEVVNFNQSRDLIFNIYMNGYLNSKEVLLKNHIALPEPLLDFEKS